MSNWPKITHRHTERKMFAKEASFWDYAIVLSSDVLFSLEATNCTAKMKHPQG